ncbi:MAG: LysM peptidoglycan-binding domain-containing protein [Acidimicrobiales bacterium]
MSATTISSPVPEARLAAAIRVALSAALCTMLTWLLLSVEPHLPGQPLQPLQLRHLGPWLVHNPPDAVAARLVWGLGLLAGLYLALLHLVGLLALTCRSARLLRSVDRASGGLFRKLGAGAAAAGLCGTVLSVGPAGAATLEGPSPVPTTADNTDQYRTTGYPTAQRYVMTGPDLTLLRQGTDPGPPPMKLLPPTSAPDTGAPSVGAASASAPSASAPSAGAPSTGARSTGKPSAGTSSTGTSSTGTSATGASSAVVDRGPVPVTATATPLMRLIDAPASGPSAGPGAPGAPPAGTTPLTWEVRQGDNLWDIATAVQASVGATDDEAVHGYWLELIAANRDRLSDPNNPDLIFMGQQLLLPPAGGTQR